MNPPKFVPDGPKGTCLNISLSKDLMDRIGRLAQKNGMSKSAFARQALRFALAHMEDE